MISLKLTLAVIFEFEQKQIIDEVKKRFDLPCKTYNNDSVQVYDRCGNERIKIFIHEDAVSVAYLREGEGSTIGKTNMQHIDRLNALRNIYRFNPTRIFIVGINNHKTSIEFREGTWSVLEDKKPLIKDLTRYNLDKLRELI